MMLQRILKKQVLFNNLFQIMNSREYDLDTDGRETTLTLTSYF